MAAQIAISDHAFQQETSYARAERMGIRHRDPPSAGITLIPFQPRFLLFPPGRFILRREGVGRRRKVVAKVVKIDQILALGSQWQLHLVADPRPSVPPSMNWRLTSRSRRDHALTPWGSRLLEPAAARCQPRTHRARLLRQTP